MLSPGLALGCSCVRPDVIGSFKKGADVFIGRVSAVKEIDNKTGYEVTFIIHRSFNTHEEKEKVIRTGYGRGDCGYPFEMEKEYFVVAEGHYTGVCNGTKILSEAQEEIDALEQLLDESNIFDSEQSGLEGAQKPSLDAGQ